MSFKTLSIADIHLNGGPETDEAEALLGAARLAVRAKVDAVFVNGDIYHAKSTPIQRLVFKRFLDSLVSKKIPVVVLRGNHDEPHDLLIFHDADRGVFVHEQPESFSLKLKNGELLDVHTFPHFNAAKVALEQESLADLGEVGTGLFDQLLEGIFQNVRTSSLPSILLAHGVVSDAHLDNGMIPKQDGIILNGDKLAMLGCPVRLGHYHAAQEPRPNVRYSGSITLRNFGEHGDKGVLIDTWEEGKHVGCDFVSLNPAPRYTLAATWDGEQFVMESPSEMDGMAFIFAMAEKPSNVYEGARVRFRYQVKQSQAATVDIEPVKAWFEGANVRELKLERDLIIETAVRSSSIQQAQTELDMHLAWLEMKGLEDHVPAQRELYNQVVKGIEPAPESPSIEVLKGENTHHEAAIA